MRKIVYAGTIGLLLFFVSTDLVHPQAGRETLLEKESQAQAAVDKEHYVIGPEDVLYVLVWREDSLSRTVPVRIDGNISLPLVHEINAAGLTPLQLEEAITERLKGFFENPNVSVNVMEANSFKVYVSGEVRKPGVYRLRSETTILQIIPIAGGLTEWAKENDILVLRKENGKETRITVSYKKAVKGDLNSNVILKPGDTIIIEASRLKKNQASPRSVSK